MAWFMPAREFHGVLIALCGGILDNVGVCLQKLSHKRDADTSQGAVAYWKQPLWVVGLCLYLSGTALNAVGLGLAPQSMLAVLGAFTLVYNTLNARIVLGEKLTPMIAAGTATIIVGSVLAVVSGSRTQGPREVNLADLAIQFIRPAFLIYLGFLIGFLTGLRLLIRTLERHICIRRASTCIPLTTAIEENFSQDLSASPNIESSGRSFGPTDELEARLVTSESASAVPQRVFLDRLVELRALAVLYPMASGAVGSITALIGKCSIVLVIAGTSWTKIPMYLLLLSLPFLGVLQVHVLNMGMRGFDQLLVIPVYVVTLEAFNIVGGGIFFEELTSFTSLQAATFVSALAITFTGVVILAIGQRNKSGPVMITLSQSALCHDWTDTDFAIRLPLSPHSPSKPTPIQIE